MNADGVTYNDNSPTIRLPEGSYYLELSQSEKNMIDLVFGELLENVVLDLQRRQRFRNSTPQRLPANQVRAVARTPGRRFRGTRREPDR